MNLRDEKIGGQRQMWGVRTILGVLVAAALLLVVGCGPGTTTTSAGTTGVSGAPATSTTSLTVASTTLTAPATSTTSATAGGAAAPSAKLHSPANGSPEFKAILDALRVPVQQKLGQKVLFVVQGITVQDGFAFMGGKPVQPSGAAIDYSHTIYAAAVQAGAFDDAVYALLRWTDGSWKVLAYNIGATDVTWSPWAAEYGAPQAIFPGPGN
jgi:hypothetical protein